jgi:hypothetical protein
MAVISAVNPPAPQGSFALKLITQATDTKASIVFVVSVEGGVIKEDKSEKTAAGK